MTIPTENLYGFPQPIYPVRNLINFFPPLSVYVVGPNGNYRTIQAALNAANAAGGGTVYVQPGTYTENLTLYDDTEVVGAVGFADIGNLVIVGVHTPPLSGGFVFRNVVLQSATHIFNSSAAGSAHLIIGDAAIIVTNGYTFNLPNWTGKLEVFDVNDRASTNNGFANNTGGSELAFFTSAIGSGSGNSMVSSGVVSIFTCAVGCPINFGNGSNVFLEGNVHTNTLTFSGNSTGEITYSEVDANIVMSSSQPWLISESVINTASNPAISGAGAGQLTIAGVSFISNSSLSGTLSLNTTSASLFGEVRANGDVGGGTGYTSLTATNSSTISTGVGSVRMSTGNAATNTRWIKIYVGTVAHWIPAWTTNAP